VPEFVTMASNLSKSDEMMEQGSTLPPASASKSRLPKISNVTDSRVAVAQPLGSLKVLSESHSAQDVSNGTDPIERENSAREGDTTNAQPSAAFGNAANGKPQSNVHEVSQGSEKETRHDRVSLQSLSNFSEESFCEQMVSSCSESEGVGKPSSGTQSCNGVYSEVGKPSAAIEVSQRSTDDPTKQLEILDLVRDDGPLQKMFLHFGADVTPIGGQKTMEFSKRKETPEGVYRL
jgi:hypothetical protein